MKTNQQKTKSTPQKLGELRQRRKCLEIEREIRLLETSQKMLDSATALESWSNYNIVDPSLWRTDSFGREATPASFAPNHQNGGSSVIGSEQDLASVRSMARLATSANCCGAGILENLTNYVVGIGFQFSAASKNEASVGLLSAVQDVIDEFLDDNHWTADLDRELFKRCRRDGEFFLALYPTTGGRTKARVIEPDQVTDPGETPFDERQLAELYNLDIPHATDWSFGIHTAEHDVQTVHGYHIQWRASAPSDYLPAAWVEHCKANVDRNVKRGLSDFFPAWRWLERQERLLQNTVEGAAIQASIAFIRQHLTGVKKGQVQTMIDEKSDLTYDVKTAAGLRQKSFHNYESGTVLDIPKGLQYMAGPLGAERGSAFIGIAQAILRHVATRWAMPEYMISGDASNANYSSSLVAESPFVKNVQAMQATCRAHFSRIIWKVLRAAALAGRFDRFGREGDLSELSRTIQIEIEPPQISTRNPDQETNRRKVLHASGVLSKKTWTAQEELDWRIEQANASEEKTNNTKN